MWNQYTSFTVLPKVNKILKTVYEISFIRNVYVSRLGCITDMESGISCCLFTTLKTKNMEKLYKIGHIHTSNKYLINTIHVSLVIT